MIDQGFITIYNNFWALHSAYKNIKKTNGILLN